MKLVKQNSTNPLITQKLIIGIEYKKITTKKASIIFL